MGLFLLYSYSLLCWIIVCCILSLPLYLPSSLASSILCFLAPLVSTCCPALHLRFPDGSSPACPSPSSQLITFACTLPASSASMFPRSSLDPFVVHYLSLNASWVERDLTAGSVCGYWVLPCKQSLTPVLSGMTLSLPHYLIFCNCNCLF